MTLEWHIWDLPDNVRVYFTNEFRIEFFNKLKGICGSRYRLAKLLNLHCMTIKEYELGHSSTGSEIYISAKVIRRIIQIFRKDLGDIIPNKLESKIIAYRSKGGWSVRKPILPIKESPELYSLAFHLICDGCDSAKNMPYYC